MGEEGGSRPQLSWRGTGAEAKAVFAAGGWGPWGLVSAPYPLGLHVTKHLSGARPLGSRAERPRPWHSSDLPGRKEEEKCVEGKGDSSLGQRPPLPSQACGVDFEIRAFCAKSLEEKSHKR